jgi:DNA adenine methylase
VARPIVKWVGGKAQLLDDLLPLFPRRIKTYFEPFIGGGACFFTLAAEGRFEHAVINDWNRELTDTYRVVRDFPDELMAMLKDRERAYAESPEAMFHTWRSMDPKTIDNPIVRAARFIFLNKAGFNGLYRVNKKGEFNAPWGQEPTVRTFEPDNIADANFLLNWKTTILTGDFEDAIATASAGDFVYFDPPYVEVSETSDFTSYTAEGFGMEDQKRLYRRFKKLYQLGVYAIISNSDSPVLREMFAEFEIHEVDAKRNINSKGEGRGPVKELLIVSRLASAGSTVIV